MQYTGVQRRGTCCNPSSSSLNALSPSQCTMGMIKKSPPPTTQSYIYNSWKVIQGFKPPFLHTLFHIHKHPNTRWLMEFNFVVANCFSLTFMVPHLRYKWKFHAVKEVVLWFQWDIMMFLTDHRFVFIFLNLHLAKKKTSESASSAINCRVCVLLKGTVTCHWL